MGSADIKCPKTYPWCFSSTPHIIQRHYTTHNIKTLYMTGIRCLIYSTQHRIFLFKWKKKKKGKRIDEERERIMKTKGKNNASGNYENKTMPR